MGDQHVTETQQTPLRVVIVDDDPFVRTSLSTILSSQEDIEVIGEGQNGLEAQALFDESLPDILLMDIQMSECGGLDAAAHIIGKHPTARIVFLTTFADDDYIVQAFHLGSRGYLIKQEVATIAPALRSVMNGHMVLGNEVIGKIDTLMDAFKQSADGTPGTFEVNGSHGLSPREFEIVELIAQGLDNKDIAAKVFASEGTVRNHVSSILQKLGLKNRTQIAVFYYKGFH